MDSAYSHIITQLIDDSLAAGPLVHACHDVPGASAMCGTHADTSATRSSLPVMTEIEVCDGDVVSQATCQHAHLVIINTVVGQVQ